MECDLWLSESSLWKALISNWFFVTICNLRIHRPNGNIELTTTLGIFRWKLCMIGPNWTEFLIFQILDHDNLSLTSKCGLSKVFRLRRHLLKFVRKLGLGNVNMAEFDDLQWKPPINNLISIILSKTFVLVEWFNFKIRVTISNTNEQHWMLNIQTKRADLDFAKTWTK